MPSLADQGALQALPARQGAWVATQTVTAAALAGAGLLTNHPQLALATALGVGAATVNLRRLWALPVVVVTVLGAALLAEAARLPGLWGAGLAAGALAVVLLPQATDALDALNGALGTAAGAALGLWASTQLLPAALPEVPEAALMAALVGLVASQGLVVPSIRLDGALPSRHEIRRSLTERYRPRVFTALDLFTRVRAQAPDGETRRGLREVARWVYELQRTLMTLDRELVSIDPRAVQQRIDACAAPTADEFTRERQAATATHLRRLLDHRSAIEVERGRTDALADYAIAFLEEARAGLAVARPLPGEAIPDRLPEVLHRLRTHSVEGDARRRTQRELAEA